MPSKETKKKLAIALAAIGALAGAAAYKNARDNRRDRTAHAQTYSSPYQRDRDESPSAATCRYGSDQEFGSSMGDSARGASSSFQNGSNTNNHDNRNASQDAKQTSQVHTSNSDPAEGLWKDKYGCYHSKEGDRVQVRRLPNGDARLTEDMRKASAALGINPYV